MSEQIVLGLRVLLRLEVDHMDGSVAVDLHPVERPAQTYAVLAHRRGHLKLVLARHEDPLVT